MNKSPFSLLDQLKKEGSIGLLEFEYAKFLKRLDDEISDQLLFLSVLAVHHQAEGNICLNLSEVYESDLGRSLGLHESELKDLEIEINKSVLIGKPGEYKPLIYSNNRLYLHKYWSYENELLQWLKNRKADTISFQKIEFVNSLDLKEGDALQNTAIALSVLLDFLIISGGPGTGKTYTANRTIKALKDFNPGYKIAMAAPTGKAAERLNESMEDTELRAVTIHRLLGARLDGDFSYNRDKKLSHDVILIDEASMLDIRLWVGLIRAIKPSSKLILLGDKDQLSSVEAGSVLGDICTKASNSFDGSVGSALSDLDFMSDEEKSPNQLNNHIVLFEKSYRTKENSGISEFAKAINEQDSDQISTIEKKYPSISIKEPERIFISEIVEQYTEEILIGEHKTQFLCSNKNGKLGTVNLNFQIEQSIKSKLKISAQNEWYAGRRIVITKNDYQNDLRNGEVGVCEISDGEIHINFPGEKSFVPSQLKDYDLAYAITVHKSQGSEFEHVKLFLSERENSALSKELLYTGVTRARLSTLVIGYSSIFSFALNRAIRRSSGIPENIL